VLSSATIIFFSVEEPIEVIVVNQLMKEVDNRVIGLKRELVMDPIFIWQHETMGVSSQYSLSVNRTSELLMDETYASNEKGE
jgi:hypothetical protein